MKIVQSEKTAIKVSISNLFIFILLAFPVSAKQTAQQVNTKDEGKATFEIIAETIQVASVAVGVVGSVMSFTSARKKDADAKKAEAAKPFLELRQKLYLEVVHNAAVLSNLEDYSAEEISEARKKFRKLYVAELSLIEASSVEQKMIELATIIDPELVPLSPAREATYKLSHALRDSLIKSWNLQESIVNN